MKHNFSFHVIYKNLWNGFLTPQLSTRGDLGDCWNTFGNFVGDCGITVEPFSNHLLGHVWDLLAQLEREIRTTLSGGGWRSSLGVGGRRP